VIQHTVFSDKGRSSWRPLFFLLLLISAVANARTTRVTLLHFSDYHSHALPFYSEGREAQGGIARAIGYLRAEKRKGALVFSGGDTINKGSPAWSDKYRCAEWLWFNGVIDAMALGNHDPDYGFDDLEKCLGGIRYPVLSANTNGFMPSHVFVVDGIRIGVFAVAGEGYDQIVASVVIPKAGAAVEAEALRRWLRGEVSAFKVPKLVFVESHATVPRTRSGKLDKRAYAKTVVGVPNG